MNVPHAFPSLLDPSRPSPVLLIGAGMSHGLAPAILTLTQEVRDKHVSIIAELGITIDPPLFENNGLYKWADDAFRKLTDEKKLSTGDAKLKLADAMGITTDPRFHAKIGIPLRGNTPRHRVAARLAREGRWSVIWSLNWDCILESALESTGLLPHPDPAITPNNPLPWKRWYCSWSPGDTHTPNENQPDTLHVIKPHGCVNKLVERKPVFVITKTELESGKFSDQLSAIPGRMKVAIPDVPLTAVGWGAQEEYMHKVIEAIKQDGTLAQGPDRLSVIDPFWKPEPPATDNAKHNKLASAFNTDRKNCHFHVSSNDKPISTDQLFQWLQTRYGLERLEIFAEAQKTKEWKTKATILQTIKSQLTQPVPTDWLNHFFDDFLAVWVRFCCNAAKVTYKHNAATIHPDVIATHRRDDHIPWGYGQSDRYDLLAIIPLILALRGHSFTNPSTQWNFDEFPGALWNERDGHLVLPLPAWDEDNKPIELAAIQPLMNGWNWSRKGITKRFSILPLLPQPDYAAVTDKSNFRSSIAWLMKSSRFSAPNNIEVVTLADI